MKKRIFLPIVMIIILLLIPICCNAITQDEVEIDSLLSNFNNIKPTLLLIFISILIVNLIVSVFTILIVVIKKKKILNYAKFLILFFEITFLVYFIYVKYAYKWSCIFTISEPSYTIGRYLISSGVAFVIAQLVCIKWTSKLKERFFLISAILGFITILGVFISGNLYLNSLKQESNRWDQFHKNNPGYIGQL
jgi:hypothetical protein